MLDIATSVLVAESPDAGEPPWWFCPLLVVAVVVGVIVYVRSLARKCPACMGSGTHTRSTGFGTKTITCETCRGTGRAEPRRKAERRDRRRR